MYDSVRRVLFLLDVANHALDIWVLKSTSQTNGVPRLYVPLVLCSLALLPSCSNSEEWPTAPHLSSANQRLVLSLLISSFRLPFSVTQVRPRAARSYLCLTLLVVSVHTLERLCPTHPISRQRQHCDVRYFSVVRSLCTSALRPVERLGS